MKKKNLFKPSTAIEREFARALKAVGRASGSIVKAHVDEHRLVDERELAKALQAYSKRLEPWARRQAKKMLEATLNTNRRSYRRKSKEIGKLLKLQVAEAETGRVASRLMDEQVELIKSIPLKAGLRAQHLARQAIYEGTRAADIAKSLEESEDVSESQAKLIARTEVARANASITEARAKALGARGYIWRTTMDGAERESHRKMNGKYVEYAHPPTLVEGKQSMTGHAGEFPNCRCYQDVQFDEN
jgi:SPP1 gp7 family putative phage head morphogenesis protein